MATAGRDRPPTSGDNSVVTACGRRVAVRCLRLGPAERPISRVTLDVGRDQGDEPGVWAALTADEARDVAHLLLRYADLAENDSEPAGPTTESSPSP
ncbi:hypothetical protein ACIRL0_04745 [Streptomyces sp. NPDC102365]|uniref:hypothetical protein n=1 Tax=Streptomyces sp. NPDC102365 TaxID=3366162 RepID=UPI003818790D